MGTEINTTNIQLLTPEQFNQIISEVSERSGVPIPLSFENMSIEQFNDEVAYILDGINDLLTRKRQSYGPGNLTRHGEVGIIVRMGDKMQRLDNYAEKLMSGRVEEVFADGESIQDCYRDIIGYATLALLWHRCNPRSGTGPE